MSDYWFGHGEVANARASVADGLYRRGRLRDLRPSRAGRIRSGSRCSNPAGRSDALPCGLGARDTLRLEAGMRLHGNDIDEDQRRRSKRIRTGSSAGRRTTFTAPPRFVSRRRMVAAQRSWASRCSSEASAGTGTYRPYVGDARVGGVTGGTQGSARKKAIGMALCVHRRTHAPGTSLDASTSAAAARARGADAASTKRQGSSVGL